MTRSDSTTARELDVRDTEEPPFERISAALSELGSDESLVVVNSFEPEPLYDVLDRRGFDHETERVADDEWRVHIERAPAETRSG